MKPSPKDLRNPNWQQHRYERHGGGSVSFLAVPHAAIKSNSQISDAVTEAGNLGASRFYWNGHTVIAVFRELLEQDHINLALGSGGDIYGHAAWIEIQSTTDPVPVGVVGQQDDDGNALTWEQWVGDGYAVEDRDGRLFVHCAANTNSVPSLKELQPVIANLVLALPEGEEVVEDE